MNPTIAAAIIGGLAGLCTGILGSLVAPWVQWSIEKKRKGLEYKQKIIADIRKLLDETPDFEDLKFSSHWGFIYQNLTTEEQGKMPSTCIIGHLRDGIDSDTAKKQIISNMLHRLEQKWGLITA